MKLSDNLARSMAERRDHFDDDRCQGDEGGYVLALTALLMLPLLAFTGFAVDLGAWYAEAAKLQRTSDAASLAAVTFLPDESAAQDAAEAVLERNGYDPSQGDYDPIGTQQYQVDITQTDVDQYFTSIFVDEVTVERSARAEFIHEVALGSPRNFIGTYTLFTNTNQENYSLSVNSPCSSREQGDLLLPVTHRNWNSPNPPAGSYTWRGCDGANVTDSPTHDADGYLYAVEVPEGYTGGSFAIRAYNAAHCPGGTNAEWDDSGSSGASFTTHMTVYRGSNDLLDPTNNPIEQNRTFTTNTSCDTANTTGNCTNNRRGWCTLAQINSPQAGAKYFVQVRTTMTYTPSSGQSGINSYSLAVYGGGAANFITSGRACSGSASVNTTAAPYSANCVRIYAIRNLSLYTHFDAPSASLTPSFYLADIGPEHSNKQLEVTLFDTGEGTTSLEVIQPDGTPAAFDYEVINETGGDTAPFGGQMQGTGVTILDTKGTTARHVCGRDGNPQAGVGRNSGSKYNDRQLKLTIQLPADIATAYGGQTWWKIRYRLCTGGNATDRATWGAGVKGDPVRLIPQ